MQWRQRGILVSQRIYATYMQRSTMSNGRFGTVLSSNIIMALLLSCIYCTQNNGDRYRQLSQWGPGEASYKHQLFYVRGRLVWMPWSPVTSSYSHASLEHRLTNTWWIYQFKEVVHLPTILTNYYHLICGIKEEACCCFNNWEYDDFMESMSQQLIIMRISYSIILEWWDYCCVRFSSVDRTPLL